MHIITNLTRMWLTRSVKPFIFKNEYDQQLPFLECDNLGLYVHIPFCQRLCNFCPYCKVQYSRGEADRYIDALLGEIRMVGSQYNGKKEVTSLYFGGGTPVLATDRLQEIIDTIREYFIITEGIGAELHPDNVTPPVLRVLKNAGVTKISIGIQSFQKKFQNILGRKQICATALKEALSEVPFETVSMDFIFALPGQTFADLQADIDAAFSYGANHIAIYPFIDFTFTASKVSALPKKEKHALLDQITEYCLAQGYVRSSIWTFSASQQVKYSSMTRDNFLGFGCSATTLLRKQFKFFGVPLKKMYGFELKIAKLFGLVTEKNEVYHMTLKGAFYYHYYENFYTLAYIDKMWGIMRKEAFPRNMVLF